MPQKFPFARGYDLAEELCANAKRARKQFNSSGSWLDFQILLEGSAGSIGHSRRLDYTHEIGRPYQLDGSDEVRSWKTFEEFWKVFRGWPRSRAKRLLEHYARSKEDAVKLLEFYESRHFTVPGDDTSTLNGVRFDALEMLDFHLQPWAAEEGHDAAAATN